MTNAVEDRSASAKDSLMKVVDRFIQGDLHGIHYAVSIFFATAVLWICVHKLAKANPVWSISSMIATSDPLMKQAKLFFKARLVNTLVGCAIGLLFIAIGGSHLVTLPVGMAVTVLVSSYIVRIPTMWRQAPITAAFTIAAGLEHHSRIRGLQAGVGRVTEVLFGCIIGFVVAWIVSIVWPIPEPRQASGAAKN
jgi:uncharacterized membrane protein YccC